MAIEQAQAVDYLLAEELLLLALKPGGALRSEARKSLPIALPGAVLVELAARSQILVHRDDVMLEPEPPSLEDELLAEALTTIEGTASRRGLGYWTLNLAPAHGRWRDRVAERLVERGVLSDGRRTVFGLFPRWRYPVVDRATAAAIAERLRAALYEESPPGRRTLLLLSLANACGLVGSLVPRAERREAKRRAKELTAEERIGREVSAGVAEVQAAAARYVLASSAVFVGPGGGDGGGGAGGAGGG